MRRFYEQINWAVRDCPGLTLTFALLAPGQLIVSGPPPEVRNHIDALVKAANGSSSEGWEKMAQEHFSPDELKRHSVARKQVFGNLSRDFARPSHARL